MHIIQKIFLFLSYARGVISKGHFQLRVVHQRAGA